MRGTHEVGYNPLFNVEFFVLQALLGVVISIFAPLWLVRRGWEGLALTTAISSSVTGALALVFLKVVAMATLG